MSLNRISYLESWVQNPASFLRQPYRDESPVHTDDEAEQDLPEDSLASSFPSTLSYPSPSRHRLNFNPYAGPGWGEASGDDPNDDRQSLLGASVITPKRAPLDEPVRAEPVDQGLILKPHDGAVLETTGAFEVGRSTRILQVCIAVVYCFLAAGIVFGFAALKPVLIKEGAYRNKCSKEELDAGQDVCYGQEIRLNLMFTIAAVATNVSALPVGTILDTYGPRVCGVLGSICLAVGTLLFGLAHKMPFDSYIPGYLFLSLGGPFVFISSFHLSNTFPTRSGLILSMLTGAFDASSALFLIFRLINDHTGGSFSSRSFFTLYLIVPLFILLVQLTIMPKTSYKTAGELVQEAKAQISAEVNDRVDEHVNDPSEGERQRNYRRVRRQSIVSKIQDLLTGDEYGNTARVDDPLSETTNNDARTNTSPRRELNADTMDAHSAGGVWGVMHGYSALKQVRSPWFVLITLFTVLQMLRINYFVASIRQQYEYLFSSREAARRINETFDFLLPIGGLISVPFIGTILDTASTPYVLLVLVTTATIIGFLGCIPHSFDAAYTNIVLFVIYRPFYYTAVSDYSAKVFGFQTFGKVYGLIICLAGIGNFAQAGLDALTFKTFHRNPIPVNSILTLVTCLVGTVLVVFVWWRANVIASMTANQMNMNENGTAPAQQIEDADVIARDWEREPLLHSSLSVGRRESPSYGIAPSV